MMTDPRLMRDMARVLNSMATEFGGEVPETLGDLALRVASQRHGGTVESDFGIRTLLESSNSSALLAAGQPHVGVPQQRPLFLRDLCPVVPTTTYSTPFVKELNPQTPEMGASAVAEGATSTNVETAINFTPLNIVPGTLPVNITVTDQLWNDSPAFVAYINQRLPYLIGVREELAAFGGNGEVPNAGITGILHDSSVTATSAGASLIATIITMWSQLAGNGVIPTAVFVNALDWPAAVTNMNRLGTWPPEIIALLPQIIPTVSLARGTVIAGDFANGAAFVERAGVTVTNYTQHSDYRARNLQLVQVQERIGFAIIAGWRFTFSQGVTP